MSGNYNHFREWMYKMIDEDTGDYSAEYLAGVEQFITFANNQPLAQSNGGKFYCPCSVCKNDKFYSGKRIWKHLLSKGFMPGYHVWYKHGEEIDMDLGTSFVNTTDISGSEERGHVVEDRYVDMVNDAFRDNVNFDNNYQHDSSHQNVDTECNHSQKFYDLLEGAKNPLYDGCREGQSQLSLAAWVMQNKADHNMSENLVDSVCEMLADILPAGNKATRSHYETEKLMRGLGLPYYTIDVCINNCMIFWKEDEKWDKCRFFYAPRWKPKDVRRRTNVHIVVCGIYPLLID